MRWYALTGFAAILAAAIATELCFGGTAQAAAYVWPQLTQGLNGLMPIAAPVAFISLASLVVPLLPRGARSFLREKDDAPLAFSAIRCSTRDDAWTADKTLSQTLRKRAVDYPFNEPYAYRFTCWRGMLLNTRLDPVLDVTLMNRSTDAFVITKIGIEILRVGSIRERRDPLSNPPAAQPELKDAYVVVVPDTQTALERVRAVDQHDSVTLDCNCEAATRLSEPLYVRPGQPLRFDLQLRNFCEHTPLHALARLHINTDDGSFRSPVIYFRR